MKTNPNNDPTWQHLASYFSGECSPDERIEIERWIHSDPARRASVQRLQRAWEAQWRDPAMPAVEREQLWTRVEATTGLVSSATPAGHHRISQGPRLPLASQRPRRPSRILYPLAILAAVLVIIVVTWNAGKRYASAPSTTSFSTYATTNGQRATITLPDSSLVLLDVASRLQVPADYTRGNHTLRLDGEALFTVTHHSHVPFTVVAGASTTRVLGTSFIVRHYTTDSITTVAVREGKVAVRSVIVAAQQQVNVGSRGMSAVTPAESGEFSFASGVLTLGDMQLSQAISELNRWYDADIHLANPALATQHIKGNFAAGSLADLQEILELALAVRVVRDGRTLTLYPRG